MNRDKALEYLDSAIEDEIKHLVDVLHSGIIGGNAADAGEKFENGLRVILDTHNIARESIGKIFPE